MQQRISILLIILFSSILLVTTVPAFAASLSFALPNYFTGDGQASDFSNSILQTPVLITYDDSGNATWVDGLNHTISITVHSTSTGTTIPLTLVEIDPTCIDINCKPTPNTGFFRNNNLAFMNGNNQFPIGRTITITITDPSANSHNNQIDPLSVSTFSNSSYAISDPGITLTFNETGINTGVFVGKIKTTSGSSSGNAVHVEPGDILTVRDNPSGVVANAIITPNPRNDVGGLYVIAGDNVTATYEGLTTFALIGPQSNEPGGGGGGLVISPGLVLDALAAIGGSPYVISPPSFGGSYYHFSDGLTLNQGDNDNKEIFDISKFNAEIPKQIMQKDKTAHMTFKTFESYNPASVVGMTLYFIPRGQDLNMDVSKSIADIEWKKGSVTQIDDPNHILSNVDASSNTDGKFQYTKFVFDPTKSFDKMSFIVRAWNDHRYTMETRLHDASNTTTTSIKTLPAGVVRYNNFDGLISALEKDQFYKPQILSHIHGTNSVFPNSEGGNIYWLYDTINHVVTLVISDKDDNNLFSYKSSLEPYAVEKKGDYKFMYFTVKQLNRWNEEQEQKAMNVEEEKAMNLAQEKGIMPTRNWQYYMP